MVEGLREVRHKKQGHPRKCSDGWASLNNISDKTFNKWRKETLERNVVY